MDLKSFPTSSGALEYLLSPTSPRSGFNLGKNLINNPDGGFSFVGREKYCFDYIKQISSVPGLTVRVKRIIVDKLMKQTYRINHANEEPFLTL